MANRILALVTERSKVYGEAWLKTGFVLRVLEFGKSAMATSDYVYAWMICINKLVRLMTTPNHLDSWEDLAGYATLVSEDIRSQQESKS